MSVARLQKALLFVSDKCMRPGAGANWGSLVGLKVHKGMSVSSDESYCCWVAALSVHCILRVHVTTKKALLVAGIQAVAHAP